MGTAWQMNGLRHNHSIYLPLPAIIRQHLYLLHKKQGGKLLSISPPPFTALLQAQQKRERKIKIRKTKRCSPQSPTRLCQPRQEPNETIPQGAPVHLRRWERKRLRRAEQGSPKCREDRPRAQWQTAAGGTGREECTGGRRG